MALRIKLCIIAPRTTIAWASLQPRNSI